MKLTLNDMKDRCFAETEDGSSCLVLSAKTACCGTCECPFYKPKGCDDWIRTQDGSVAIITPPEDYYRRRRKAEETPVWRITRKYIDAVSAEQHLKSVTGGGRSARRLEERYALNAAAAVKIT